MCEPAEPGRQAGIVPQAPFISDPELADWVRPAGQSAPEICLCLPTAGDNRSPPPALTLFGLIWGFCSSVCVFTFISSVGHRVEVRELAQVVPLLAPCGFWGLIGLCCSGLKASAFT